MTETIILPETDIQFAVQAPWNVIVYDDPVNLMGYVTYVLKKVFGYSTAQATRLMKQVHNQGLSIVWTGELEKAELYTQQLQFHQLKASLEKAE